MLNHLLRTSNITNISRTFNRVETRSLFYWLEVIFNRVNKTRVRKYGPDRVCSEWLLRNGAAVKWKGYNEYENDYNNLPEEDTVLFIEGVDATGSDIHDIGLHHFDGCKHIEEVILVHCKKISDLGLPRILFLKDSLLYLEIRDCKGVTHDSLHQLSGLRKLRKLKIGQLPYVEHKEQLLSHLKSSLPLCEISYEN